MKCDNCKNKPLCKYTEECNSMEHQIKEISGGKTLIFKVSLNCDYYEEQKPAIKNPFGDSLTGIHTSINFPKEIKGL